MTANHAVDRLVIATISGAQSAPLLDRLAREGFYFTQLDSSGGIMHDAAVSLLVGLNRERLPCLLESLRTCCHTRLRFIPAHAETALLDVQPVMIEAEIGGATIYVLEVERFEQL